MIFIIGCQGVPVFAQFSAGVSKLVGPTGGFLVGFVPQALLMGLYIKIRIYRETCTYSQYFWNVYYIVVRNCLVKISATFRGSLHLQAGFTPFIIVGIMKGALAAWVGILVRKRLISSKLLFTENANANTNMN